MIDSKILFSAVFLIAFAVTAAPVENPWMPKKKKLIDLSWSNPHVDYLAENLERMEAEAPVDGITIRYSGKVMVDGKTVEYHSHHSFNKIKFQEEWFADSIKKLKSLKFKKFTDNFLYSTMVPADVDWFSDTDWDAVCNNYRILAKVARETGMKGILFDSEEYAGKIWCNYEGHTHDEAVKKARERGRQFGRAIFEEYPQMKFFSLFLFSFGTFIQGDSETTNISHSFYNGMYDVLPPEATMIDGHEFFGYFAKNRPCFEQLRTDIDRTFLRRVAKSNYRKYRSQTQFAAPFYLDSVTDVKNPCYKFLLPEIESMPKLEYIRRNFTDALEFSDEYVWFYGENGCWWSKSSHPKVKKTWDEICPGIKNIVVSIANPQSFNTDVDNMLDIPKNNAESAKWSFWKAFTQDTGNGGWKDGSAFIKGPMRDGCVYQNHEIIPGHDYMLRVEFRVKSNKNHGEVLLSAPFRNTELAWMPGRKKVSASPKEKSDWQILNMNIKAPEKSKILSFQMIVKNLEPGDEIEFRRFALVDMTAMTTGKKP